MIDAKKILHMIKPVEEAKDWLEILASKMRKDGEVARARDMHILHQELEDFIWNIEEMAEADARQEGAE